MKADGIQTLSLDAAIAIVRNLRAEDLQCFEATMPVFNADLYAINRWQSDGAAWHLLQDGRPVVMGGITMVTPWIGLAWMVVAKGVTQASWKRLLRFSRTVFKNARQTFPRIEAHVLGGWTQAGRYASTLGFVLEGTRRRVGRDGQDVLTFAMIGG